MNERVLIAVSEEFTPDIHKVIEKFSTYCQKTIPGVTFFEFTLEDSNEDAELIAHLESVLKNIREVEYFYGRADGNSAVIQTVGTPDAFGITFKEIWEY